MQFYKFAGMMPEEKNCRESESRHEMRARARKIARKSQAFHQQWQGKAFLFIAETAEDSMTIGIIWKESKNFDEVLTAYLKHLELELQDTRLEEITFSSLYTLLRLADQSNYIDDKDKVLEQYGLDKLETFGRRLDFDEELIQERSRTDVYAMADRLFSNETLVPELDRIYARKASRNLLGHPVHYMIQTDDCDLRRGIYQLLLQSLYTNGRLRNKRYCLLDFQPGETVPLSTYDALYQSCFGGAVVVRYRADNDTEDDCASCGRETVEVLCETMKKYRNQVLTVFCLPRECTQSKELFYENLGNTSFVELKEDLMSSEQAVSFLKMLASDQGVRSDKNLFASLDSEKGYLAPELHDLFDAWYDRKLKTAIYPQYKEIVTAKHKVIKAAPKGSAYDELMEMVGLDEAKRVIHQALNYYKAQKLFADKGMKTEKPTMHMVFSGNPGTAKTSVARLFARIMRENGLLSNGRLLEVGRGDLVGKYVGWTAPAIQKKFREAQGGVLFIDEAYSLVDDRSGSFGDEAINTIVQEMENHRDDVVVIFAGYPEKLEDFLQKNPGLRSRIAFHVPFADYNTDELCRIAGLLASRKGLSLTKEAQQKLAGIFDAVRQETDFGNGRYVRNVMEKAKMAQATRLLGKDPDSITKEDIATLCAEDIEMIEEKRRFKKQIGFCA